MIGEWHPVDEAPLYEWVVVVEEDDAGWAYALGEFTEEGFVSFDHTPVIPLFWTYLPKPPMSRSPDMFKEA